MTAAEKLHRSGPLPLSIPPVAHDLWFACGCLEQDCRRSGFQADALPYVVAAELRGMAGEILARADVAREQGTPLDADDIAWLLSARADRLDGVR